MKHEKWNPATDWKVTMFAREKEQGLNLFNTEFPGQANFAGILITPAS